VLLARIEALDEMEAAAEQRFTTALARERAELAKQARSLLCTRGSWLQRPSLVRRGMYAESVCNRLWTGRLHMLSM